MLLSNLDAQLNSYIRVQNEVAARSLMRDALSTFDSALIPEVYGWSSAAEGQGWIMEQYIPGEPLNNGFEMLSSNQKRDIMAQLARTFILMQSFELHFAIKKYAGLRYDDKGEIYNGPIVFPWEGPFETYEDFYIEEMKTQLESAESTSLADG